MALNHVRVRPRISGMETIDSKEQRRFDSGRKRSENHSAPGAISAFLGEGSSKQLERRPFVEAEYETFFSEPADPRKEALAMATHVICRLLVWMADGRTLEARGLRACVALFCIRPDLVDDATLERIGTLAGCSRQAVHKLAVEFRETTGLHA